MCIIQLIANENGSRPPIQEWGADVLPVGFAICPKEMLSVFATAKGFVNITVENDTVVSIAENTAAKKAWEAMQSEQDIGASKSGKLAELGQVCNTTITAGCDVTLSDGTKGYISMSDEDQINLMSAIGDVQQGAAGAPYHLDGTLCRIYSAADIGIIATAAKRHKLYHTTYCNHLNVWVRRSATVEEVQAITYGAPLPADLESNLREVLREKEFDIQTNLSKPNENCREEIKKKKRGFGTCSIELIKKITRHGSSENDLGGT